MVVVTGAGRLREWSQGELRLYQEINLKRHLFTKARLNRSVFTLGSMKSWPLSLRALLRLGGSKSNDT